MPFFKKKTPNHKPSFAKKTKAISGTTYALLVGLIGVVAITAISGVGGSVDVLFSKVGNSMDDVASAAAGSGSGGGSEPDPEAPYTGAGLYITALGGGDCSAATPCSFAEAISSGSWVAGQTIVLTEDVSHSSIITMEDNMTIRSEIATILGRKIMNLTSSGRIIMGDSSSILGVDIQHSSSTGPAIIYSIFKENITLNAVSVSAASGTGISINRGGGIHNLTNIDVNIIADTGSSYFIVNTQDVTIDTTFNIDNLNMSYSGALNYGAMQIAFYNTSGNVTFSLTNSSFTSTNLGGYVDEILYIHGSQTGMIDMDISDNSFTEFRSGAASTSIRQTSSAGIGSTLDITGNTVSNTQTPGAGCPVNGLYANGTVNFTETISSNVVTMTGCP